MVALKPCLLTRIESHNKGRKDINNDGLGVDGNWLCREYMQTIAEVQIFTKCDTDISVIVSWVSYGVFRERCFRGSSCALWKDYWRRSFSLVTVCTKVGRHDRLSQYVIRRLNYTDRAVSFSKGARCIVYAALPSLFPRGSAGICRHTSTANHSCKMSNHATFPRVKMSWLFCLTRYTHTPTISSTGVSSKTWVRVPNTRSTGTYAPPVDLLN